MRWIIALGYSVFFAGLVGIGYGTWSVYEQHRKITTFEPVEATVLKQRVEQKKSKFAVQFMPVVEYEYAVGGETFQSEVTLPTESRGPKLWAEDVLKRFPVGNKVEARVDPDDPTDSFLIPKYGPLPYLTILNFVVIGCMGIGVVAEQKMRSDAPPELPETFRGTPLVAKSDHRHLQRLVGIMGTAGLLIGAPAGLHYFHVSTPPVSGMFRAMTWFYSLAGVGMIGWSLFSAWTRRGFGNVAVEMDTPRPAIGEELRVRLSLPIHFAGTINSLALQLILERKSKALFDISPDADKPDPILYAQREVLFENHAVQGNETLDGEVDFTLPPILAPSTPPQDKSKKHYVWTLQLRAEASGFRTATREYILDVGPASDVEPRFAP